MTKNLHGITITIPDHMHATVAVWAMERGIAVHCQKPLTQTVWEARLLTKAAQKYKVVTQMGNQGYSSEGTRVACEGHRGLKRTLRRHEGFPGHQRPGRERPPGPGIEDEGLQEARPSTG